MCYENDPPTGPRPSPERNQLPERKRPSVETIRKGLYRHLHNVPDGTNVVDIGMIVYHSLALHEAGLDYLAISDTIQELWFK